MASGDSARGLGSQPSFRGCCVGIPGDSIRGWAPTLLGESQGTAPVGLDFQVPLFGGMLCGVGWCSTGDWGRQLPSGEVAEGLPTLTPVSPHRSVL